MNSTKAQIVSLPIVTSDGEFIAHYSDKGLAELDFPTKQNRQPKSAGKVSAQIRRWHQATTSALKNGLTGKDANELPPLDLSSGTDFQRAVWAAMLKIRPGQTRSYGEIADAIGKPKALRAVGGACGANPIPVLIPCHRVIAANKKIGGFSADMNWKRTLLAQEGVSLC